MGIILEKPHPTGAVVSYHRISECRVQYPGNGATVPAAEHASVVVESYVSKEARNNKKSPLTITSHPAPMDVFDGCGEDSREVLYKHLHTLSAFEGGVSDED